MTKIGRTERQCPFSADFGQRDHKPRGCNPWAYQAVRCQGKVNTSNGRPAYTLIEMLLVVSLMSVAMTTLSMLLFSVWQVQHAMDNERSKLATLERLGNQFRSDVHAADSAAIRTGAAKPEANGPADATSEFAPQGDSKHELFALTLNGGKEIDYQLAGGVLNRTVRVGDVAVARESYSLPAQAAVRWEITSSDVNRRPGSWQVSLFVSFPLTERLPEFAERRELRIDAVGGLQMPEIRLLGSQP